MGAPAARTRQGLRLLPHVPRRPTGRRSLRALSVSLAQQQGRNESTVFRQVCELSRVWQWHARCSASDQDLDRQAREGMLRRHPATLARAEQILAHPLNVFVELLQANPLLPQQLAGALLSELRTTRPGAALAVYDRLLSLIAKTALASAQLIPVERLSRGMSSTNAAVGLMEDAFDGDSARRVLDAGDPDVAALVRAVLVRAHGGGTRSGQDQPSAPDAAGDTEGAEEESAWEVAADGPAPDAANGVYASAVRHV